MMQAPKGGGSDYYNYKGTRSIVLLAIANAQYRFIIVDIGKNGQLNDAGIFGDSEFLKALEGNRLDLPGLAQLPDSSDIVPHVFIGDNAFPLRNDLMTPFPGSGLSDEKKILNYHLSRARRILENTFGILASKW